MSSARPNAQDPTLIREQLLERFGASTEDDLLAECVKICQAFNDSADNLFFKWESTVFNQNPKILTVDSVKAVRAKYQSELTKAQRKLQPKIQLSGPLSKNFFTGPKLPGARLETPRKPRHDGFGMTAGDFKMPIAGPSKVKFVGSDGPRTSRAYRYMYEKVSERSEALDDRIDDVGELVQKHYNVEDLGDPSASTEEEIVVVGRIAIDIESSSGPVKLNEASLTLESSRMMGSGARVPLRFDPGVKVRQGMQGTDGAGLFPGAVVALKGKNGGGGWFLVTEILSLPALKPPTISNGDGFSMCIACGPFTPDADLKYKPWQKLLSKLKADKPAAVLLTGPFIDSTHSCVKIGDVDQSPAELFRDQFLIPLRDFLASSPDSIVMIVPSVRDMISDHTVYPQCELDREFSLDPRVHLLPNPSRFLINGVSFAVSSLDVLFHLRKEEFFKRAQEVEARLVDGDATQVDTMANTVRHLLQQRSFYPIFPVPLDLSHDVNLDVSHWRGLDLCGDGEMKNTAPAVIITPSKLKHFSKTVDSTVAINPSFLTKNMYATLTYAGVGDDTPMKDRIKADIVRLE